MKSLHDYRGEYAAACRHYQRAFNRWWLGAGSYDAHHRLVGEMFAARDRYHARLNTPKSKAPSKRQRRRMRDMLAQLSKVVAKTSALGPMPTHIYVSSLDDIPAQRAPEPRDTCGLPSHWLPRPGVPVTVVRELARGTGFVEYSDGSIRPLGAP
jgi:hypothetical protein